MPLDSKDIFGKKFNMPYKLISLSILSIVGLCICLHRLEVSMTAKASCYKAVVRGAELRIEKQDEYCMPFVEYMPIANRRELISPVLTFRFMERDSALDNYSDAIVWASKDEVYSKIANIISEITDVNFRDNYGATLLMYASSKGDWKVVNYLLNNGANINMVDWNGESALMYAVSQHGNEKVIRLLVDYGANLKISDKRKVSICEQSTYYNYDFLCEH